MTAQVQQLDKTSEITEKDIKFDELSALDEQIDGLLSTEGQNFDERDNDIVGTKTEKMENLSDYATRHQKLTVAQKVERELTYVTEAMGLDIFQQKHWRYKLKREYEE